MLDGGAAAPAGEAYPRSLWLAIAGTLAGAFQFGYQVGVLNTALPFVAKDLRYHRDAALSSAVVLGAALGALTAGRLADGLGPRHAQAANCIAFVAGCLLSGLAGHPAPFLAGRFVAGIGAGGASLYVPRYIAEVSPPALRGRLGSLNQVLINAGILAAYCAGIPYEAGLTGFDVFGGLWCSWWRVMIGLGVLPAVAQVLIMAWCPESPVWLESIGRRDAADAACLQLWGSRALVPEPADEEEPDVAHLAHLLPQHHRQPAYQPPGSDGGLPSAQQQQQWQPGGYAGSSGSAGSLQPGARSPAASRRPYHHHGHPPYEPSRVRDSPAYAASAGSGSAAGSGGRGGGGGYGGYGGYGGGYGSSSVGLSAGEAALLGRSGSNGGELAAWGGGAGPGVLNQAGWLNGGAGGAGGAAGGGWDSLLQRRYRWMMALALGLPLLQQASGINTVVFYSSRVFAAAGLASPIAGSIITGGVNLLVTMAAGAAMDRCGRKPLLLLSYMGMAVTLGCVAGLTLLPLSSSAAGSLMVLLVLVYVAFFATGSGPVTWLMLSEVLPPAIKGPAASLATAAGWAGSLLVTSTFEGLLGRLGLGGTYLLYGLANAAAVGYVAGLVVETKCRSLAEIEGILLLPDMDPRLAALLPALQRSGSNVSSTAATTGGRGGTGTGGAGSSVAAGSDR